MARRSVRSFGSKRCSRKSAKAAQVGRLVQEEVELRAEHLVIDAVRSRERFGADRGELLLDAAVELCLGRERGGAEVAQAAVGAGEGGAVGVAAERSRGDGVELER